ncbi:MAG: DNA-3-methyladenine glycosylase I [Proteobacteria bacterium]|nr:DNA-3-methyladenine glycosylase I [Pseudomonadota bacterium]
MKGHRPVGTELYFFKKRNNYKKAFKFFDPKIIFAHESNKIVPLLPDKGIIRNKLFSL